MIRWVVLAAVVVAAAATLQTDRPAASQIRMQSWWGRLDALQPEPHKRVTTHATQTRPGPLGRPSDGPRGSSAR
jgi:hypothetical protein